MGRQPWALLVTASLVMVQLASTPSDRALAEEVAASSSTSSATSEIEPSPVPTTPEESPSPRPKPVKKDGSAAPDNGDGPGGSSKGDSSQKASRRPGAATSSSARSSRGPRVDRPTVWWDFGRSYAGLYSTSRLQEIAARLKDLGIEGESLRNVYAPFIVAGRAEFSDTWGQPRHAEGDELRPHLGQDVFCDYGAPVLASEKGRIELTTDPLGGFVVRLHRDAGGYWYYSHLASWNTDDLSSGDRVQAGDVIGYCGTSGNAAGTPPHVHFGWYPGPANPMGSLIGWLRAAEAEAERKLRRLTRGTAGNVAPAAGPHRFGDAFAPDLTLVRCASVADSSANGSRVILSVLFARLSEQECSRISTAAAV